MALPLDICRCLDTACEQRWRCERWLQRGVSDLSTPFAQTLYHGAVRAGRRVEECDARIPPEQQGA
jgi:hypothetical protein